ncbi:5-methylcytosine rRNA methyltransferase NSUN4 isoform X2 [Athalia rosae]|nr:5-methylcytosine rRNA methyltransferase NSUN4 isoform X2 [Athalia rosae]
MALVNNFSDTEKISETLQNTGAINLRTLYYAQQKLLKPRHTRNRERRKAVVSKEETEDLTICEDQSQNQSLAQVSDSDSDDETNNGDGTPNTKQQMNLLSIADSKSEKDLDEDRIIDPNKDLVFSSLYQYIPATKLKGMEDYILESEQFDRFRDSSNLTVKVEKERKLRFPKFLNIYTYEEENDTRFKSPRKGSTGVLDYYLLDGGSILPVLALDLQAHDDVLDMCAAPGGKTLAVLQTLLPSTVVANDNKQSRTSRLQSVFDQYLNGMAFSPAQLSISLADARDITDQDVYNKILVDVPCTTDRHSLHEDDNNIFKSSRIKERLQLPELQAEILLNALKIVRPGGTVVYSTCSLSPIQNDGVVQMALKKSYEETNSTFVVRNMSASLQPLKYIFNFSKLGLKYGQVVVPSLGNNFGPMYFCKIIKVE